ncbi:APC family permease [Sporolactobacillus pectinivorans]|uniref:APC family permease n=1 Tax=Sporolactobacillus pectinivorans TaxID=1591408 RepID=UPI000C257C75|nr:APC family permease [Sporolactobacillus pectinivorans]
MADSKLKKGYLSMIEVLALSVSIVAPTMAMAFNTAPTAGVAGTAVPLSFLLGTIAMILVGVSFVEFSKRIPHSGSVYAYNTKGFGPKTGFVSGWSLAATYFCYSAGCAALFGNFANVFLLHFGIHVPEWILVMVGIFLVWFFSYRDIRLSTRAALMLECISIVVVLILCFIVVGKGGSSGNNLTPFTTGTAGISGIGAGMIFAILSFAGFEGASTLAEEAKNPKRAIPVAILGTVIMAGIFYVFVSYAQVIGFGVDHIAKLSGSNAPLDVLASRYVNSVMGTFIDFAAMISAFACSLGSANAGSRILFALGRDKTIPEFLSYVHPKHGTPVNAVNTISLFTLVLYLVIGLSAGASNFYAYFGTIGTFTLLFAYIMVNLAAIRYFRRNKDENYSVIRHLVIPILGFLSLLWPIYGNVYPVPSFPFNIFPYIAAAWIILGIVIIAVKLSKNPEFASHIGG